MKTNELTGAALDWAVDKCNFMQHSLESDYCLEVGYAPLYSIDWAHGGPIIEREQINVQKRGDVWLASVRMPDGSWPSWSYDPTPLIAAMRCYVASKLGDNIELPRELTP